MNPRAESQLQRLYGLPAEEFTRARDAAVRSIRDEDRDAAEIVAAARRPTRAAWAVNQLARNDPTGIRALLDSAERLRESRTPEAVREAMGEQRDRLEGLVRAARERLDLPEATVERVRETLQAATVDPETRDLVERGRLTKERRAAAFVSGDIAAGGSRPTGRTAARSRARHAAQQRLSAARARTREASAELERAVAAAEEARAAVETARARLARAEREEAQAQARLES